MNMLIEEKAKTILKESCNRRAIAVFESGEKRELRIFKSSIGNYCYKPTRRRNSGYPLSTLDGVVDLLPITAFKRKSEPDIWYDSWDKVKQRLEKSKLWPDYLVDVKTALNVGYEKIHQAYKQYWVANKGPDYKQNNEINAMKIDEIDPRLVSYKDGIRCVNTRIVWDMSHKAKVKKMKFYKDAAYNQNILDRIAIAMLEKKQCFESGSNGYDISFEYSPDKGDKAWYSEEFKGCGNGHYYLALDATHALFHEDD